MNNGQFQLLLDATFDKMRVISESKGQEYAGSDDRLANFKRLATELGLEPEVVLWVFLTKHLDSIRTYLRDLASGFNRNYSEPITGRIDDAILYLILLKGLTWERSGLQSVHVRGSVRDPSDDFDEAERTTGPGFSKDGVQCSGSVDCGPGAFDVGGGQMVSTGHPSDQYPV